jgi:hypothetical protein
MRNVIWIYTSNSHETVLREEIRLFYSGNQAVLYTINSFRVYTYKIRGVG